MNELDYLVLKPSAEPKNRGRPQAALCFWDHIDFEIQAPNGSAMCGEDCLAPGSMSATVRQDNALTG